jgi:hypothetical protein
MPNNQQQPGKGERSGKSGRGFASMDAEQQRQIARKGGESVPPEKRSFSQDRALASEAGRKGGQARGAGQKAKAKAAAGAEREERQAASRAITDEERRAGEPEASRERQGQGPSHEDEGHGEHEGRGR